jgi:hypothetical protein
MLVPKNHILLWCPALDHFKILTRRTMSREDSAVECCCSSLSVQLIYEKCGWTTYECIYEPECAFLVGEVDGAGYTTTTSLVRDTVPEPADSTISHRGSGRLAGSGAKKRRPARWRLSVNRRGYQCERCGVANGRVGDGSRLGGLW